VGEIEEVASYFYSRDQKSQERKKYLARKMGKMNTFYNGRFYFLYHLSQCAIFWIIAIVFPNVAVVDCENGHYWMSHISFALYLILVYSSDSIFVF